MKYVDVYCIIYTYFHVFEAFIYLHTHKVHVYNERRQSQVSGLGLASHLLSFWCAPKWVKIMMQTFLIGIKDKGNLMWIQIYIYMYIL